MKFFLKSVLQDIRTKGWPEIDAEGIKARKSFEVEYNRKTKDGK